MTYAYISYSQPAQQSGKVAMLEHHDLIASTPSRLEWQGLHRYVNVHCEYDIEDAHGYQHITCDIASNKWHPKLGRK